MKTILIIEGPANDMRAAVDLFNELVESSDVTVREAFLKSGNGHAPQKARRRASAAPGESVTYTQYKRYAKAAWTGEGARKKLDPVATAKNYGTTIEAWASAGQKRGTIQSACVKSWSMARKKA